MAHLFVACRNFLDATDCTVALAAETDEELIEAAIEHAYACHAEEDTPALRQSIRECVGLCDLAVVQR